MLDPASPRRGAWRRLPRTIRGLALLFAGISALVPLLLGGATYWVVHEEIERQIDQRVEVETRALVEYERGHGFDALLEVVRIRDERGLPGDAGYLAGVDDGVGRTMGYIVRDAAGRRRAGSLRAEMPPPGWSEFVHFIRPDGSRGIAQAIHTALPGGGQLLVAADREIVDRIDDILLRLFASAFGALLLIGTLAALAFGRIVRRRVAAIELSANAIIAGDMSQRMPLDGSGVELDRLAIVLNQMLDRIAALVANLREVSNGLAHDLRTPLSRLRARLEHAEALTADPPQRDLLDAALAETDALLALFASLLAIAEIDGRTIRSRFVAVDLADALTEIVEAHRPAIEDAGLVLTVDAVPATVNGDRPLLQRIVANLLDNALVHTPAGTRVTLSLVVRRGEAIISVTDDGPGVDRADLSRIFDRLIRLDASRSIPGQGLGLSMVAAIAEAHGGRASATVANGGGLQVDVALPRL